MDENLVVNLDEIKGIRLQCKECGSEAVVNPADPYPYTLLAARPRNTVGECLGV